MTRWTTFILGAVVLVGLMHTTAQADVIVVKKGRGVRILGIDKTVGDQEVTESNWRIYLGKSEGVIVELNYDSIVWKKNAKTGKVTTTPMSEVKEFAFKPESRHQGLDLGNGALANGNLATAIREFKSVLEDENARPADKAAANFQIGYAYLATGRLPSAQKHFQNWSGEVKSKWTPEAYRFLAEIHTSKQKYPDAIKAYQRIQNLPDIPASWKLKADCGLVKVMIAQRQFDKAEAEAKRIAGAAPKDQASNDIRALAIGLQAKAIIASQQEARLPDAERLVQQALELKGVSSAQAAFLNSTLGDALYAQGRLEDARFPYLRVVELYPQERGFVANCLLNAGNCFIDMAIRAQNAGEEEKYCELLVKGMSLISECGMKYRGSGSARTASGVWRKNKAAYEACKKKK
jgi:tetratricopeptide (TPR) repeat protein